MLAKLCSGLPFKLLEPLLDRGVGGGGASVVIVVHEQGRGRASGTPFDRRWAQLWTFNQGRIIRWALFSDKAEALEAAGLSE